MTRKETIIQNLQDGCVIPAIPLALTEERSFDMQRQRVLLRYYLEAGADGIAAAVHTTQFEIRKPEYSLLKPILQVTSEEIDYYQKETGKTILKIAGVCGRTEQAVEEASLARSLGFDAVLLSPGGLDDLSEKALIERTENVADLIPVIGFCLQPAVGGRIFSYSYWQAVCEIDNVIAIKSAPFNRYLTLDLVKAAALSKRSRDIALYTGNDDNILFDLLTPFRFHLNGVCYEKRFAGGLLGQWSVWTHTAAALFSEIKQALHKEEIPVRLLTLAAQVTHANAAIFDQAGQFAGCIPGIHEILRRQGLLKGIWCLNPAETLSEGQSERITEICDNYAFLTDDAFVTENLARWEQIAAQHQRIV